jgi:aminopeptidase
MDEISERIYFDRAADEVFDQADEWLITFKNHYANINASFLGIYADDSEIMSGVDSKKMSRNNKAYSKGLKTFRNRMNSNKNAWCEVCMPSVAWAKKAFPEQSEEEAMASLWLAILKSTRADQDDPIQAWKEHQLRQDAKIEELNTLKFTSLKYKNSLGTNLIVELPEKHIWRGCTNTHAIDAYKFIPNMPGEEIFTLPKKTGVNGRVVGSYPLVYDGVVIRDFWFEFEDGLVVDYGASENLSTLREILETDKGAKFLGEVALVPYDSPISNQGILFYDTLFDENASCHFALGQVYPFCIEGGEDMSEEELEESGVNTSMTHVDFMIGTDDLEIIGLTKEGEEVLVFSQGNFI